MRKSISTAFFSMVSTLMVLGIVLMIAIDDLLQLLTAVRTAITLFCDQIINAHRITLLVFSIVRHCKI